MIREFILNLLIRLIWKLMSSTPESPTIRIGDRVKLLNDTKNIPYVVYSITYYHGWRKTYTLWCDAEYEGGVEEWQIALHQETPSIWFITPYEVNVWE